MRGFGSFVKNETTYFGKSFIFIIVVSFIECLVRIKTVIIASRLCLIISIANLELNVFNSKFVLVISQL